MYLSIMDASPQEQQERALQRVHDLYSEALEVSNSNAVAMLNKFLLEWQMGHISDEYFQLKLQADLFYKEAECAKLMYILFKKHVQCQQVHEDEFQDAIKSMKVSKKMISNLT